MLIPTCHLYPLFLLSFLGVFKNLERATYVYYIKPHKKERGAGVNIMSHKIRFFLLWLLEAHCGFLQGRVTVPSEIKMPSWDGVIWWQGTPPITLFRVYYHLTWLKMLIDKNQHFRTKGIKTTLSSSENILSK